MDPETSELIRKLIRGFVAEPQESSDMRELQKTAEKYELLPPVFAWDPFCISPNGEIISFGWDDHETRSVERDRKIVNAVLFQGIKMYPQLVELMPVRSVDDIECQHCAGTGVEPLAESTNLTENIICYCGGLGWLPGEN